MSLLKIKLEPKDELLDDGLCVIETLNYQKKNDIKKESKEEIQIDPVVKAEKSADAFVVKPDESKMKVEPKDEAMDVEFHSGLRVLETLKCGSTENTRYYITSHYYIHKKLHIMHSNLNASIFLGLQNMQIDLGLSK